MAVCQNLVPLVNIKIAGKWMFIPLKMVLIGIDPYPYLSTRWMIHSENLWDPQDLGRGRRQWAGRAGAVEGSLVPLGSGERAVPKGQKGHVTSHFSGLFRIFQVFSWFFMILTFQAAQLHEVLTTETVRCQIEKMEEDVESTIIDTNGDCFGLSWLICLPGPQVPETPWAPMHPIRLFFFLYAHIISHPDMVVICYDYMPPFNPYATAQPRAPRLAACAIENRCPLSNCADGGNGTPPLPDRHRGFTVWGLGGFSSKGDHTLWLWLT